MPADTLVPQQENTQGWVDQTVVPAIEAVAYMVDAKRRGRELDLATVRFEEVSRTVFLLPRGSAVRVVTDNQSVLNLITQGVRDLTPTLRCTATDMGSALCSVDITLEEPEKKN